MPDAHRSPFSPSDPAAAPRPTLGGTLLATLGLALACNNPAADETRKPAPPPPGAAVPDSPEPDPAPAEAVAAAPEAEADPPAAAAAPAEPPPPTFGPAGLTVLDPEKHETFLAGAEDDPIPVDTHYVQSNETRHDLFFPYITELGGAYVGVGSDQNYTMMAAARSEYAFLMDIDTRVADLHRMYDVFIQAAQTPQDLLAMWSPEGEKSSTAMLDEALADHPARRRILGGYRIARETVYRHLQRVIGRDVDGEPASWLSEPEMYEHVRAMFQTSRVRIMIGDLAGGSSLQTIGAAASALGTRVEVLYMSNAEEYFKYTPRFVANIEALPIGEGSMVLRTIYSKRWEHADLWAYQVQPLADLRARLQDRRNRSRNPMLRLAENDGELERDTGHKGLSLVAVDAPDPGT